MESEQREYRGHRIEVPAREAETDGPAELIIDGERFRYGRHVDGEFFLFDYAYHPGTDLFDLAGTFIDYRERAARTRSELGRQDMEYQRRIAGLEE